MDGTPLWLSLTLIALMSALVVWAFWPKRGGHGRRQGSTGDPVDHYLGANSRRPSDYSDGGGGLDGGSD